MTSRLVKTLPIRPGRRWISFNRETGTLMLKLNRGRSNRGDTTVKVAVITAIGAIIVALITAYLHPNPSNGNNQPNIDVEKIIQQQQQMLAEILQLQAELQNAHNPADAA